MGRPVLGAAVLAGVGALALLGEAPWRERLDRRLTALVQRRAAGGRVAAAVAEAPHEAIASAAVLVAALVLVARGRRGEALRLVLASGTGAVLSVGTKRLLRRPRPPAALRLRPVETSGRFPSGHATSAAIAALGVSRALAGLGGARVAGTAAAALLAVGVGASRVRLGEHYPSDVLASDGLVLAAALALPVLNQECGPESGRHAGRAS